MATRGRRLYTYQPPRAHPIVYAAILVSTFVWMTGSLEAILRGTNTTLVMASYGAPVMVSVAAFLLGLPSATRIYQNGIAPSRPLILRWHRRYIAWEDLLAVYPSYYDVTGGFVSPFASSDGKVTQIGIGLEDPSGRVEVVRFTPSRFEKWQPQSAGYRDAIDAVRQAFGDRPLTPEAPTYDEAQREAMLAEAKKPFLPFFAILFLFASAAPVLWILTRFLAVPWLPALALSLLAPFAVSSTSYLRARRRNTILNQLAKSAEYQRHTTGERA